MDKYKDSDLVDGLILDKEHHPKSQVYACSCVAGFGFAVASHASVGRSGKDFGNTILIFRRTRLLVNTSL